MAHRGRRCAVGVVVLLITSAARGHAQASADRPDGGRISGTVRDSAGATPCSGVARPQTGEVHIRAIGSVRGTSPEAADPNGQAPSVASPHDWTGFHIGTHLGYGSASSDWSATQLGNAPTLSGSLNFFRVFDPFDGAGSSLGGFQIGYDYSFPSRLVIGVEADVSFPGTLDAGQDISSMVIGTANYHDTTRISGTVRGRVGYDRNHWLYYATGGVAWTYDRFTRTQLSDSPIGAAPAGTVETSFLRRIGWTVGAGIEVPIVPGWTMKFEYLYSRFGKTSVMFPLGAQRFDSDFSMHEVRWGLNYTLGGGSNANGFLTAPAPPAGENWSIHGQTTLASQYASSFRTPYRGQNSLDANAGRETWDITLYAGFRLWDGADLWINPEIDQGFGLSSTLGVAGFPNGNAYKLGSTFPYLRMQRAFIRQTIALGGETEKVEADLNQFGGSRSSNRLVVTLGKFAVWDWFDANRYAHEPRSDFLNWALIDTGTFDYAADSWGYTYGAAVEWYQGPWTLRGGLLDLSDVPNSPRLDPQFQQFQWIGEIEHRHQLGGQPGKIIATGFLSRGRMGRYDDALTLAQLTKAAPNIALVRRYASRSGISINLEQPVSPDLGVFARTGLAVGSVEPYEFTDIDRTIAAGLSLSGKRWARPNDTFGLAGVVNGISGAHAAYLNAGGLGILVGDGRLPNPGSEWIIEALYSFPVGSWLVTADYQLIVNPAYNRERGPVSVIGARLHAQF
jgi:high affinity Mn2+ porin